MMALNTTRLQHNRINNNANDSNKATKNEGSQDQTEEGKTRFALRCFTLPPKKATGTYIDHE